MANPASGAVPLRLRSPRVMRRSASQHGSEAPLGRRLAGWAPEVGSLSGVNNQVSPVLSLFAPQESVSAGGETAVVWLL